MTCHLDHLSAAGRIMALCTLLLPHLASAEGAVRVLDCEVTLLCDAQGSCSTPPASTVEFRMEPESLATDGSGTYRLRYDEVLTAMQASSEAGPFLWTRDAERHALLASSETAFLWHTLDLADSPTAQIRFLRCSFRQ